MHFSMPFYFMRNTLILLFLLAITACSQKKEFNAFAFTALSAQQGMLSEKEHAIADINIASIPGPDVRSVSGICKKLNFQTAVVELDLDQINPDSNFSHLSFLREQLSERSASNTKGAVFIANMDSAKQRYKGFLRLLHREKYISPAQYVRITEKMEREPVVYPFILFEWLETMP